MYTTEIRQVNSKEILVCISEHRWWKHEGNWSFCSDFIPTITKELKGHKEESIDLKLNEAYGPVEKRIITGHKQAYGRVQL